MKLLQKLVAAMALVASPIAAQEMEQVLPREAGEGGGPYGTLVIRGATMIDGTGAPPEGPVDIVVEGNRIAAVARGGAPQSVIAGADRVVDAQGMYVLPGFVDVHGHNGDPDKAPQPSYGFNPSVNRRSR